MGEQHHQGKNQKASGNKWKSTNNNPKLMGHSKGSPEREVRSEIGLPKKDRNISNKPNPTSTRTNNNKQSPG